MMNALYIVITKVSWAQADMRVCLFSLLMYGTCMGTGVIYITHFIVVPSVYMS